MASTMTRGHVARLAALLLTIRDTTPPRRSEETPAHHREEGGYRCPWPSCWKRDDAPRGLFHSIYVVSRVHWEMTKPMPDDLPRVRSPDWGFKQSEARSLWAKDLKATWLGHATVLVEFPAPPGAERGLRVLFDPILSHRCSPSTYAGPARVTPAPLSLQELPHVDIVALSHDHYDHLVRPPFGLDRPEGRSRQVVQDTATIQHIHQSQPKGSVVFFSALGCGKHFESWGIAAEQIRELDWWDEREVAVEGIEGSLRLVCTPSQHAGVQHKPSDGSRGSSVWFGGDTGYCTIPPALSDHKAIIPPCPAFKEIGERLGDFDLAFIPIGAYSKDHRYSIYHCSPEQAVEIHKDVRARRSLGIHWGTWQLASEPIAEPPERYLAAGAAAGMEKGNVTVCDIGETLRIAVDT